MLQASYFYASIDILSFKLDVSPTSLCKHHLLTLFFPYAIATSTIHKTSMGFNRYACARNDSLKHLSQLGSKLSELQKIFESSFYAWSFFDRIFSF